MDEMLDEVRLAVIVRRHGKAAHDTFIDKIETDIWEDAIYGRRKDGRING